MKKEALTPSDRIRKSADHPRIHMDKRNEPNNRLEKEDFGMEKMETFYTEKTTRCLKNN